MSFAVGSLVRARGREWVVQPESQDDLLILRPVGGTDDEIAGVLTAIETVGPAAFRLPDPQSLGDDRSCRFLRDAVRLGVRSSAGPFRSFGRIGCEPRPYQLVPLLMALKLDPLRLLIADDVGIGKTIEALLVASELLAQGEVQRMAVLCPPHLAEQWQSEMRMKFHLDATLVLASTAARLERDLGLGESLFDRYPFTVVSTDFIKSDRRSDEFLRACPELVIVDEAHTCADPAAGRGGRHQRFQLVSKLAGDPHQHLMLVTATPHSGNEAAFRNLIGFLDRSFKDLPEDLTREERSTERRRLARHMVQRRRADIKDYLGDTRFPDREGREETYALTSEYKSFFDRVMSYVRETVRDPAHGDIRRQRVRWWSALGLLRALASSPAAAAETLRTRAVTADTVTAAEADEVGRRAVLDVGEDETLEGGDVSPGADPGDEVTGSPERRRLLDLAREADTLLGALDAKLAKGIKLIRQLVDAGFHPIVFCRFIATAEYVKAALREALPKGVEVVAVTGQLTPEAREERVLDLTRSPRRVLVATDCLSEGINLQDGFDAVFHYDLSWNPTRHEQREGRVDRFGQPRATVRVLMYWGADNQIDGIVLEVLLRKHKAIRDALGISVPVPTDTTAVLEAILEGLLLRGRSQQLILFDDPQLQSEISTLHEEWTAAAERERRSRTVFAQELIKVEEVQRELEETRAAIGSGVDVARFTTDVLRGHGATVDAGDPRVFHLREVPRSIRDVLGLAADDILRARFDLPVDEGVVYLSRNHPVVESLAAHTLDTALDPVATGIARRAGAIRTSAVERRTTLLLVRFRFDLVTYRGDEMRRMLAEDCRLLAFAGSPERPEWLPEESAAALVAAEPVANMTPEQARDVVGRVIEGFPELRPHVDQEAQKRARALLDAHNRVRAAARITGVRYVVEPKLPADVVGIYVYLPV